MTVAATPACSRVNLLRFVVLPEIAGLVAWAKVPTEHADLDALLVDHQHL